MPGIKGKRVPGRPGRFDPTEPLHMTTRRAAKTGTTKDSPSTNGSVEDGDSRRGSLDDLRPVTSYSNGSQVSTKFRRLSELSVPIIAPQTPVNGVTPSEERDSANNRSNPLSPVDQTPSPSRKRKRSSSPTTPPYLTQHLEPPNSITNIDLGDVDDVDEHVQPEELVEVIEPDHLSDREVSPDSSKSEDLAPLRESFNAQSEEVSPTASDPVSPVTSDDGSPDGLSFTKPLDAALEEVAQAANEGAGEVANDVDVDGLDEVDDVDEQVRSDDDGRPRRRFGGRRRAQHPDPKVEAAMRRQTTLKSMYRSVARQQKAVLAEIAKRTIDDIEADPELYAKTAECESVKQGLEDALEGRQSRLQVQHELNVAQLKQTFEAEERALKARCRQQVKDLRDAKLYQIEHEILRIARTAQTAGVDADFETEDEDDVVPKPKSMGYRWTRGDGLDDDYHSRSRLQLETVPATAEKEKRFEMLKLLESLDEDDEPEELRRFTVMDSTRRDAAIAKREGIASTNVLADAAAESERRSAIPIIPNEKAFGLQMLGDLASRPSIRAPPLEALEGSEVREPLIGQKRQRPMPPHLQLQTNYGPDPVPVSMSPRTTHAFGDRFDNAMPPPATPRQQVESAFARSPNAMQLEQPRQIPQQSPVRASHSRTGSWSEGPDAHHNPPPHLLQQRSEHRPETPFMTPQLETRSRLGIPLWRDFPREPPATLHSRNSSHGDRPPLPFPGRDATLSERQGFFGRGPVERRPELNELIKNESSPNNRLYEQSPFGGSALGRLGTLSMRDNDQKPSSGAAKPSKQEEMQSPHSRRSSINWVINDFRPGSAQLDEHQDRQKNRGSKSSFPLKTNKEQRSGLSRRHWSKDHRRHSKSFESSEANASPATTAPSYAGSPTDQAPTPTPWHGPAPHLPSLLGPTPPPATQFPPQSPFGRPPPPQYSPPNQSGPEFYQHRNSFPPAPPPMANWNQLPPTPLYAVPQQHHPPPPGVPPDQYHRPFAPPPPPGYHPPSQPPTPQSAPGTYGPQFGGQTIAPAATYHPAGFRPGPPLPAFAQQAQQQQQQQSGQGHSRRRTQSDAPQFSKFHAWNPNGRR